MNYKYSYLVISYLTYLQLVFFMCSFQLGFFAVEQF